jgi:hypothetical protein
LSEVFSRGADSGVACGARDGCDDSNEKRDDERNAAAKILRFYGNLTGAPGIE